MDELWLSIVSDEAQLAHAGVTTSGVAALLSLHMAWASLFLKMLRAMWTAWRGIVVSATSCHIAYCCRSMAGKIYT